MGKVKFKFYFPEFSNTFLGLIAISEVFPDFGIRYRNFYKQTKEPFSAKDLESLNLFKQEMENLVKLTGSRDKLLAFFWDYKIDNLIILKRRFEALFGVYNFAIIDKVYLHFYKQLLQDYKLFQYPILSVMERLEKQVEDQKIAFHLEKFQKFLEQEKHLKTDHHFFVSCFYFGEGEKAIFQRILPNNILFVMPILFTKEGTIALDIDEKMFLEQIFYQAVTLKIADSKQRFEPVILGAQVEEQHFFGAFVGALHYGIYSFDLYKEELKLSTVTEYLEKKLDNPFIDKKQVSLAIKMTPLINRFYEERKGLDSEFADEFKKLYSEWQSEGQKLLK